MEMDNLLGEAGEEDDGRRVHLADLSGPLELLAVLAFAFALSSLRRRDLSLSWMCHMLAMTSLLFIIGHFLEEHALGRARLQSLLYSGFQGFGSSARAAAPRGALAGFVSSIWELSGVLFGCAFLIYSRLYKCGHLDDDPSCIAGQSADHQHGMASAAHRHCRRLRLRLYGPVFVGWFCAIIGAIGVRFNSLLGGSAIRPAGGQHYFSLVVRSGPMLAAALTGATGAVLLYAELLASEARPRARRMLQALASEILEDQAVKWAEMDARADPQDPWTQSSQQQQQHQQQQQQAYAAGSTAAGWQSPLASPIKPGMHATPWSPVAGAPPEFERMASHAEAQAMEWARQRQATGVEHAIAEQLSAVQQAPVPAHGFALQSVDQPLLTSSVSAPLPALSSSFPPPGSGGTNPLVSSSSDGLPQPHHHQQHHPLSQSAHGPSAPPIPSASLPSSQRSSFDFERGVGDVSHLISSDSESDGEASMRSVGSARRHDAMSALRSQAAAALDYQDLAALDSSSSHHGDAAGVTAAGASSRQPRSRLRAVARGEEEDMSGHPPRSPAFRSPSPHRSLSPHRQLAYRRNSSMESLELPPPATPTTPHHSAPLPPAYSPPAAADFPELVYSATSPTMPTPTKRVDFGAAIGEPDLDSSADRTTKEDGERSDASSLSGEDGGSAGSTGSSGSRHTAKTSGRRRDSGATGRGKKEEEQDGEDEERQVLQTSGDWKQFFDKDTGANYWFNENTGESSWHGPPGGQPGSPSEGNSALPQSKASMVPRAAPGGSAVGGLV